LESNGGRVFFSYAKPGRSKKIQTTLIVAHLPLLSGGNAPSYVYRLLSEYYHEDDYEL
jgi:hypothetical protein